MTRMHNPPHPGDVLKDGVFADNLVSVTDAAAALTPALPLSTRDSETRVTPSATAASVTDTRLSAKTPSFKTSPGCGGLCIRVMVFS